MGFCAFSEDPGGILCIFGSSSWDFVHFRKFLLGFCTFLEVWGTSKMYTIPWGTLKYV
jgi:hypothetical protein